MKVGDKVQAHLDGAWHDATVHSFAGTQQGLKWWRVSIDAHPTAGLFTKAEIELLPTRAVSVR